MTRSGRDIACFILCPTQVEERAIRRGLGRANGTVPAVVEGCEIIRSGLGAGRAAKAVELATERTSVPRPLFILAGVCGGLRDGFSVGTARVVKTVAGGEWRSGVPAFAGEPEAITIAGVDEPAATIGAKAGLRAATGADAVDMESHGFAEACGRRGLPWIIIRGVSDGPDQEIPAPVLRLIDREGALRMSRLPAMLLHPRAMVAMGHLGRQSARVMPQVAAAVTRIAGEWLQRGRDER